MSAGVLLVENNTDETTELFVCLKNMLKSMWRV